MEIPKHPLTGNQSMFLSSLRTTMNNRIYFYGSILRKDYIPSMSDIDVLYFADNVVEDTKKMLRFMKRYANNDPNVVVKSVKFLYHSKSTRRLTSGYKVKYLDPDRSIIIEVGVYKNEDKDMIVGEQLVKSDLPLVVLWVLYVLKILAYKFRFIPEPTFKKLKEYIFTASTGLGGTYVLFN